MRRIAAVARVETVRLFRTRIAFTLLIVVPAIQVLLFGYAIRPMATVAVAIAGPTPQSTRTVARALGNDPALAIAATGLPPGGAEAMVRQGRALIGIEVPILRSIANPTAERVPLRIMVDAANAALVAAAVPRIEAAYWRTLAIEGEVEGTGPGLSIVRLYNPDGRTDWTFLPALIGVTVMISMIMLGTLSLAREREGGTWETLLILPIAPIEALVGKLLPYAVIGTIQGVLVLAAGVMLFDLPVRGSVAALIALLPLFAGAHLVLGYAISARAVTQLAALQGAVAFYLPAMLLSGFLYPSETLPGWAQTIGSAFPLTHFVRAAQEATVRGGSAGDVLVHGWPIAGVMTVALFVAMLAHARRLD